MASNNAIILSLLSLCLTLLSSFSLAQLTGQHSQLRGQQWQHECNIEQLSAAEPTRRLRAEAGVVEVWEPNEEMFRCTGVAAVRHVIEPKGLLLPSFTNAPYVTYVVQGRGVQGVIVPGCPETFESGQVGSRGQEDQHQRVFRVRDGDVIGSPAGMVQWTYNDGDSPLVSVSLIDLSNPQNQLDLNFRSFYLAGNPQESREGKQRGPREVSGRNIFSGFDDELLSGIFNVDPDTINSLKGENDQRGSIIRVEHDIEFLTPEDEEMELQKMRKRIPNGLEETFCSLRFKHNIDEPSDVDVFSRRGGRITTLNSNKFPLLQHLQLSAERGVLNENAMMTPHWHMNAHSIMYVTKGTGRIQVARENGRLVFDGRVQEGQLLVIPQDFVVLKKAEQDGLEWVSFKTNDNAMISPLAGKISAIRGMPADVIRISYGLSKKDAMRLKYGREELSVFPSNMN